MNQNFWDKLLTTADLREMLENKNYSEMMNKIHDYTKGISGTNFYWYQKNEEMKATLSQVGLPKIFLDIFLCRVS